MTGPVVTGTAAGQPDQRQAPLYCPYCGEEDLRPAGSAAGTWECLACRRGFQLRFTGVLAS